MCERERERERECVWERERERERETGSRQRVDVYEERRCYKRREGTLRVLVPILTREGKSPVWCRWEVIIRDDKGHREWCDCTCVVSIHVSMYSASMKDVVLSCTDSTMSTISLNPCNRTGMISDWKHFNEMSRCITSCSSIDSVNELKRSLIGSIPCEWHIEQNASRFR